MISIFCEVTLLGRCGAEPKVELVCNEKSKGGTTINSIIIDRKP
jgi:hypothetical protein